MNPTLWLILAVVLPLVVLDLVVKRRRVNRRAQLTAEQFLQAFGGDDDRAYGDLILAVRKHVAAELSIPEEKIYPDDDLSEVCDRYSAAGSGNLALGDLYDDLYEASGGAIGGSRPCPKTVRDYVSAFIEAVGERPDAIRLLRPNTRKLAVE